MYLGAETIIMRTNCENDLFFIVGLWPATASHIKGEDNETYHLVYYGKMTIWGFFDRRTDTFCYVVAWGLQIINLFSAYKLLYGHYTLVVTGENEIGHPEAVEEASVR